MDVWKHFVFSDVDEMTLDKSPAEFKLGEIFRDHKKREINLTFLHCYVLDQRSETFGAERDIWSSLLPTKTEQVK